MISFISITFGLGPHSYSFQVNLDRFQTVERSYSCGAVLTEDLKGPLSQREAGRALATSY